LFGTDSVAPKNEAAYFKTYNDYKPLWNLLNEEASFKVRIGNYQRIFDEAKAKVRAWEKNHMENIDSKLELQQSLPLPKAALSSNYQSS
jgi:hypothetical protein